LSLDDLPGCRGASRHLLGAVLAGGLLAARSASAEPSKVNPPSPDPAALEREAKVLRLGIAGGMMFAQAYSSTVLTATGALLLCWHDQDGKYCGLETAQSAWYELYIPVAGPFVALHHEEVRSNWIYASLFSLSGTLQSVGFTLAAVSVLWPTSTAPLAQLPIALIATRDSQGLAFRGTF